MSITRITHCCHQLYCPINRCTRLKHKHRFIVLTSVHCSTRIVSVEVCHLCPIADSLVISKYLDIELGEFRLSEPGPLATRPTHHPTSASGASASATIIAGGVTGAAAPHPTALPPPPPTTTTITTITIITTTTTMELYSA